MVPNLSHLIIDRHRMEHVVVHPVLLVEEKERDDDNVSDFPG